MTAEEEGERKDSFGIARNHDRHWEKGGDANRRSLSSLHHERVKQHVCVCPKHHEETVDLTKKGSLACLWKHLQDRL